MKNKIIDFYIYPNVIFRLVNPGILHNVFVLNSICYFLIAFVVKVLKMAIILFELCFCALDNEINEFST